MGTSFEFDVLNRVLLYNFGEEIKRNMWFGSWK